MQQKKKNKPIDVPLRKLKLMNIIIPLIHNYADIPF